MLTSNELLIVACALREVGLDEIADRFREAIFDRRLTKAALQTLQDWVHKPSSRSMDSDSFFGTEPSQHTKEVAMRMLQRISRLLR